jgi:hypothetical protein
MMVPTQNKKSPRWQFGDRAARGQGRKRILTTIFTPAVQGAYCCGPFSFENIAPRA